MALPRLAAAGRRRRSGRAAAAQRQARVCNGRSSVLTSRHLKSSRFTWRVRGARPQAQAGGSSEPLPVLAGELAAMWVRAAKSNGTACLVRGATEACDLRACMEPRAERAAAPPLASHSLQQSAALLPSSHTHAPQTAQADGQPATAPGSGVSGRLLLSSVSPASRLHLLMPGCHYMHKTSIDMYRVIQLPRRQTSAAHQLGDPLPQPGNQVWVGGCPCRHRCRRFWARPAACCCRRRHAWLPSATGGLQHGLVPLHRAALVAGGLPHPACVVGLRQPHIPVASGGEVGAVCISSAAPHNKGAS